MAALGLGGSPSGRAVVPYEGSGKSPVLGDTDVLVTYRDSALLTELLELHLVHN